MLLRDYQEDCKQSIINALCTKDRVLAVMATGLGKTITFSSLIEALPKHIVVEVIVNKERLVSQISDALTIDHGVWCAGLNRKEIKRITVGTIQSLVNAPECKADLVIVDEVHNMSSQMESRIPEKCKLVGFTATPWRSNSTIYGKDKFFDKQDFHLPVEWGIKYGWLVPPVSKVSSKTVDLSKVGHNSKDYTLTEVDALAKENTLMTAQVADALTKLGDREKVVWACCSIEHAELVAKRLSCAILHSKRKDKEAQVESFERGPKRHMVTVMMLSEGYDFPPIDAIVCLRPTRSVTLYMQLIGRGLRRYKDKKDCLFLDYGQVMSHLGTIDNPMVDNKKIGKQSTNLKICPMCDVVSKGKKCDCGYTFHNETMCKACGFWTSKGESCSHCGYDFKRDFGKNLERFSSEEEIRGIREETYKVANLYCDFYESRGGNSIFMVTYALNSLSKPVHKEYLDIEGAGRFFALKKWRMMTDECMPMTISEALEVPISTPNEVVLVRSGKYYERIR